MSDEDKCEKAQNGKHEPDFNRVAFYSYMNGDTAQFTTWCVHCDKSGAFRVHESDVTWVEPTESAP